MNNNEITSPLIQALRNDIAEYIAEYLETFLEETDELTTWTSLICIVNDNTDYNVRLVVSDKISLLYDGEGGQGLDVMEALGRALEIIREELF